MRLSPIFEQQVLADVQGEYPNSEILSHLRKHKVVFLYLLSELHQAGEAYRELRGLIKGGLNPRARLPQPSGVISDLLSRFYGLGYGVPEIPEADGKLLPKWFKEELSWHLDGASNWSSTEAAHLSYWLVARLLSDGRFQASLDMVRRRWHIQGEPLAWYRAMNEEQDKVLAECSAHGIHAHRDYRGQMVASRPQGWSLPTAGNDVATRLSRSGEPGLASGTAYSGGVCFSECWDTRDVTTYRDYEGHFDTFFGFPIEDFESDLGALAWMAGGAPDSYEWRHWIEVALWDFAELPMLSRQDGIKNWQNSGRSLILSRVAYYADVHGIPKSNLRTQPGRVRVHPSLFSITGGGAAGIRFLSRWISIGKYPDEYHPHLVRAIVQQWGDYEEPPDRPNMKKTLRSLLGSYSLDDANTKVDNLPESVDVDDFGSNERHEKDATRQRRLRLNKRPITPK